VWRSIQREWVTCLLASFQIIVPFSAPSNAVNPGSAWEEIDVSVSPLARARHTAVYEPSRSRVVIFGGWNGSSPPPSRLNDTWTLSLGRNPGWQEISPNGIPPSTRYWHSAIYDPVDRRMLVFAGLDWNPEVHAQDTWALSLDEHPEWTLISPSSPADVVPPRRREHTAVYDPVRRRMVIFGGINDSGRLNDTWTLDLAGDPTWSPLSIVGSPPPPRSGHSAVYDPTGDRMLVFGGDPANNDVWALRFSESPSWVLMAPAGPRPTPRREHSATFDAARRRMVIYAGADPLARTDTWALSLHGEPTWSALSPEGSRPPSRQSHTATYHAEGDVMVVFGGAGSTWLEDTWVLTTFSRPILGKAGRAIGPTCEGCVSWAGEFAPNPFTATTSLYFHLAHTGDLSLSVFDITGRRVHVVRSSALRSGSHEAGWDGTDLRGDPAAAGTYFVVLETADQRVMRRVVLMR
jgi:Galactose oxidase, central domain/FlgD Ig-like domain